MIKLGCNAMLRVAEGLDRSHAQSVASVAAAVGDIPADSTNTSAGGTTLARVFSTNASKMAASASSSSDGLATASTRLAKPSATSRGSRSAVSASISSRPVARLVPPTDENTDPLLNEISCTAAPRITTLEVAPPSAPRRSTFAATSA